MKYLLTFIFLKLDLRLVFTPSQDVLPDQESTVDVHYMCAPGSADDIIWRIVNKKLQVVGETLDGHLAGTATGAAQDSGYQAKVGTACQGLANDCSTWKTCQSCGFVLFNVLDFMTLQSWQDATCVPIPTR